ncbi:MAG: uracil-DNA glycosylase [Chitinophagaceae bacterium]|nr:MAG: uracil-DNA glycosylase [Chitinophagaceae bacterium]
MTTARVNPKIEKSWEALLKGSFKDPYFHEIKKYLLNEKQKGKLIYPQAKNIFKAFDLCPVDHVKIIILGQDPYHGEGQAHGLSFSVPDGIKPPPSLKNIFKEIIDDIGELNIKNGNLENWAKQGVLLLNAILTVEASKPASHSKIGWHYFTNSVITKLSEQKSKLVFMLWGKYAQEKIQMIDQKKHLVLTAPHPSPFSADKGFFGCKHFSKANHYLVKNNKSAIKW